MQRKDKSDQCYFCGRADVSWKDAVTLRKFLSAAFKIRTRNKSGLCAKHQRAVAHAIKRARQMALLSYLSE
ncbi:MAG: 30S ribosomal protein S18 [Parcubacteria group bacterium GW2011_GWF2_46_8]|nr:MAG: 30S ribosomal protein S18 [Parcubacteria group bacterium GW2011_GWF2_46_8]